MRKIKQSTGKIVAFSVITLLLATYSPVGAADNVTVSATVTAKNIGVAFEGTDGTVAYGTVNLSSTQDTTSTGVNDTEVIRNTGNVNEDYVIEGFDTTSWTIVDTAVGNEEYNHAFCIATCDSTPTWEKVVAAQETLASAVAPGAVGDLSLDLQIGTPSVTLDFTSQAVNVKVTAAAS